MTVVLNDLDFAVGRAILDRHTLMMENAPDMLHMVRLVAIAGQSQKLLLVATPAWTSRMASVMCLWVMVLTLAEVRDMSSMLKEEEDIDWTCHTSGTDDFQVDMDMYCETLT